MIFTELNRCEDEKGPVRSNRHQRELNDAGFSFFGPINMNVERNDELRDDLYNRLGDCEYLTKARYT